MKNFKRLFSWLLLLAMLLPMLPTVALSAFAESTQKEDAMEEIKADATLNASCVGETQHFEEGNEANFS